MILDSLQTCIRNGRVFWQRHALERMLERGISRREVKGPILAGEVIEYYGEDRPCPSALVLGKPQRRALHVVAAYDGDSHQCHIITAYVPDLEHFEKDLRTRRQ